ncbi:MAG: hypothetical protein M3R59_04870 [Verrucomicrobiota bacterium]|nr:hypothetical protein [Verrucomicrobiota bacterium]
MSASLRATFDEEGAARLGEVMIVSANDGGFAIIHCADISRHDLREVAADAAREIARVDDAGQYRPLKTAPNLAHGWRARARDWDEAVDILDAIYPGRLAVLDACEAGRLTTTSLRDTLARQTGMYRVAAKISDGQIEEVVREVCRSDGGCLRTILWTRDGNERVASLSAEKFDPAFDQTGRGERCAPLLCQEACNLLVAAARATAKR